MNPAPKFKQYLCGVGTFLDIANHAIDEKLRSGEYTPADAVCLQTQAMTALYSLGSVAEMLGLERLDYSDNSPQNNMPIALMLFGRAVREMTYCLDSVGSYARRYYQDNAAQTAAAPFPPPDGC